MALDRTWKSQVGLTGLKSRCWKIRALLGGSREGSVSLPFPVSRSHWHSLAFGPFLCSKPAAANQVFLAPHSTSSVPPPPSFTFENPCPYMGPLRQSRTISLSQVPSFICTCKVLLATEGNIFTGMSAWTSLSGHFSAYRSHHFKNNKRCNV